MARTRSLLGWILAPVALLAIIIAGMWLFRSVTPRALHPKPQGASSVTAADPSPQWSEAVDRARRIMRSAIAEQSLPGLSVAVGAGGDMVWAEGFGWADIAAHVPMTPETRFGIGTASTVLTSAAVGVLLDKGRLKLDDEIQAYVPQFPKKKWPVTLRQLMAHVAGVGTDNADDGPLFRERCEHPVEAVRHFAGDALLFQPGTQYRPSKYGWILVSAAVESAADQPFLTFMREQIFQPLRMNHTSAESATTENPDRIGEPEEDPPMFTAIHDLVLAPLGIAGRKGPYATGKIPDRATFYEAGFGPRPIFGYRFHLMRPQNQSCYAGSLAFVSTPSDLVRFGLAMNAGTLLQPATVRLLQTPQRLASGQETGYGLGWDVDTVTLAGEPIQEAGHDGELRGRRLMSFMTFREPGIVVAVMSNTSNTDTSPLALKIAEVFAKPARRGTQDDAHHQ